MKAYKDAEGNARLFRPLENCKRMLTSCRALYFPSYEPKELLKCMETLVLLEKEWIPPKDMHSLYIRPSCISMEVQLILIRFDKLK
jgi:branched-chain amino acid aminotransferase